MLGFRFFADNLVFHRRRRRFTQSGLADRGGEGLTQALISRYERGLRPSDRHVDALAKALDIQSDVLLRPPRIVRSNGNRAVIVEYDPAPSTGVEGGRQ